MKVTAGHVERDADAAEGGAGFGMAAEGGGAGCHVVVGGGTFVSDGLEGGGEEGGEG